MSLGPDVCGNSIAEMDVGVNQPTRTSHLVFFGACCLSCEVTRLSLWNIPIGFVYFILFFCYCYKWTGKTRVSLSFICAGSQDVCFTSIELIHALCALWPFLEYHLTWNTHQISTYSTALHFSSTSAWHIQLTLSADCIRKSNNSI